MRCGATIWIPSSLLHTTNTLSSTYKPWTSFFRWVCVVFQHKTNRGFVRLDIPQLQSDRNPIGPKFGEWVSISSTVACNSSVSLYLVTMKSISSCDLLSLSSILVSSRRTISIRYNIGLVEENYFNPPPRPSFFMFLQHCTYFRFLFFRAVDGDGLSWNCLSSLPCIARDYRQRACQFFRRHAHSCVAFETW